MRRSHVLAAALAAALLGSALAPGCSPSEKLEPLPCETDDYIYPTCPNGTQTSTASTDSTGGLGGAGGGGAGGAGAAGTWIPVPGLELCHGEMLDLERSFWPARRWAECGTGCRVSPAGIVADEGVGSRYAVGAKLQNGDLYLRTATWASSIELPNYQTLERFSDGAILAVLRVSPPDHCMASAIKEDAPLVFEVAHDFADPLPHWVGLFDPQGGSLTAASPFILGEILPAWFSWNDGWGIINGGSVELALNPAVTELTTIFSSQSWQLSAKARGDLVAWVDWGAVPSPVRSWTKTAGERILFQGPWDVAGLALDDAHIAWVGVHGPQTIIGDYDAAELYWSPFTTDPVGIQVTQGPDLTGLLYGSVPVAVAGDYVGLTTPGDDPGGGGGLIVVEMSTQAMWFVPARPGTFMTLVGMTDSEVLVMENDAGPESASIFQRYLRLSIADLETLALGW
jgi:hypothetical protein